MWLPLLVMCLWLSTDAAVTKIRANQINLGDAFAFTGTNTHTGPETFLTATFSTAISTASIQPNISGTYSLGAANDPYLNAAIGTGGGSNASTVISSAATVSRTAAWPDASGTASFAVVEYCGATTGATQACAKTVQTLPIVVWGDVTLNTATSQSITTLPFTDALYSCSGSDLTTAAGVVTFNTYASTSVTIVETGGVNTDHLRYVCVGH